MRKIRSRILEIFDKDILIDMQKLQSKRFANRMFKGQNTRMEYSASMKVKDMTKILTEYLERKGVSYSFPGAGTNRMTVLINGYIYKIALDQDGYIDNLNEFIVSKEAQPYVTRTYETNGLLAVAEYVTLISYDEFVDKKSKILEILDDISREYLIGDMGWTQKNYTNWGYRKNSDDLVILDFGHMHRLSGEKLLCRECGQLLQYNNTFTKLKCLSCGKEEEFMTIKARLSKKEERENIDNYLERAYVLTEPSIEIKEDEVRDMSMYETVEEEELVSTRFKRFAPKKGKYDHLLDRRVEEAKHVNSLESLPEEVTERVYEDYMKVVQGKIKIKKQEETVQEPKEILDPIKAELVEMDETEGQDYIYSLFIRDEINQEQYEYYIDYIENGEPEEEVVESEVVLDVVNKNNDDESVLYDEDSDKTYVFDDDDLGIDSTGVNPADVMFRLKPRSEDKKILNMIPSDDNKLEDGSFADFMTKFKDEYRDTGDEEFEDDLDDLDFEVEDDTEKDNRIYLSPTPAPYDPMKDNHVQTDVEVEEEQVSLKVKESDSEELIEVKAYQLSFTSKEKNLFPKVEETEMTIKVKEPGTPILSEEEINKAKIAMNQENTGGLKIINRVDEKLYESKQNDKEVSLKVKETNTASTIKLGVENNTEPDSEFNNEEIFLRMREIQQQRVEEEKDYSHYEDEYSHLMEDEDETPQKGGRKNWR